MSAAKRRTPLAVIGIAVAAGGLATAGEVERALLRGRPIGPAPVGSSEPALLRRLAMAALADAGPIERAAIGLISIGSAYASDQAAGYLASGLQLGGPPRAVAPSPSAEHDALEIAAELLTDERLAAVLIAAARVVPTAGVGEGMALLLARSDRAGAHRTYALVESWARAPAAADAAERALGGADAPPGAVGWLALEIESTAAAAGGQPGDGDRPDDGSDVAAVAAALALAYASGAAEPTAVLGPTPAAGLSLVAVALCLWRRALPALALDPSARVGGPFYAPAESRPWFAPPVGGRRFGALHRAGRDGHVHVVLGEAPTSTSAHRRLHVLDDLVLLPVAAADGAGLLAALTETEQALAAGADPRALARDRTARLAADPAATATAGGPAREEVVGAAGRGLAVALLGRDREELRGELALAHRGVPAALESGGEWRTPRGSVFAPRPAGIGGRVAFVYPGAFSAYVGAARESFQLFPWAHDNLADLRSSLSEALHEPLLYPRWTGQPSAADLAAADVRLAADALAMIESGTMVATLHTRALRRVFGLEPSLALGYSLGEVMMLVALGVWSGGDEAQRRLFSSPLFTSQLVGPRRAVRQLWGLPPGEALRWETRVLIASADRTAAAIPEGERVYLTIVNGPEEVVVAGDPAACDRLVARLGCEAIPSPFDHVLHCPATALELGEFERQMRVPARPVPGIDFYSAGRAQPLVLEEATLARSLAEMSCHRLEFVQLVERAYDAGARVFVEIGPGSTTTRLVQAILKDRHHVALALSRRGVGDEASWYRALAALVAHRVPLDLSALHEP